MKWKRTMTAAITVTALLGSSFAVSASVGNTQAAAPVIEKNQIEITSGQVYDLTADPGAAPVFGMTDGSIIIKYNSTSTAPYQSLFSVSNSTAGNQDRHFHLYVTPDGTLGMELRNTDSEFKYTMSAAGAVVPGKTNIVALKADRTAKEYKLFANGSLVSTLSKTVYKFLSDITGADTISLGGTIRQGTTAYPFGGTIAQAQIYASALTDQELISLTENFPVVLEKSNVTLTQGTGYDLTGETGGDLVQLLTQGTIVVSYTAAGSGNYQSLISIGNNTAGNQDRHFHLYVTNTGALGMELRNTDGIFKYTLSRPASLRGIYKGAPAANTVAVKADEASKQYKLFANGELMAVLDVNDFKFVDDITGVNNVLLGGTNRQGTIAYPFEGTIHNIKIYSNILSDDALIAATSSTTYGQNIFYAGDATKSNYFRIPALLTLESGHVAAAADARYGGTHDSKSNIDIAFAKSTDGGATWSAPTLPFCFDDYIAKQVDWPRDSVGKNVQIQGSASFIDSVLLQDSSTKRLFLFADVMPAGIGSSNSSVGSGFKEIGGKKYMKLRWHEDAGSTYNYSIRENGVIYNDVTNQPTEYHVDGNFALYQNNTALTCKQYDYNFSGSTLLETKTNVDVSMNVFYKDSVFKVFPTNYLGMKYSDNEGETWSDMKILSSFKPENEKILVVGPGVGKQMKNGLHAGRLLVPLYSGVNAELGFMYSDDHGNTWHYVMGDHGGTGSSTAEAQIVELPDGTLKTYMRTGMGYIAEATSLDGGETWSDRVAVPGTTATSYGTQVSVINYSGLIDGKPAIIMSAPSSTSGRRDGKIRIGLITDTGAAGIGKYSIDWKYIYRVDSPDYGYSYSCLTELPNGNVGLLYEKYDSWSRDELHLKNILKYETFTIQELIGNPQ